VDGAVKKRVEDVMPIATGHEREELEAELEVLFSPPVFGK
jgi:cytochrome c oxidase subunit 5b